MKRVLDVPNGSTACLSDIPNVAIGEFRKTILDLVNEGARISALFGRPLSRGSVSLYAVLAQKETSSLYLLSSVVEGKYPALTPDCEQAHLFEREIAEQCGIQPDGHPWLKPVRFPPSGNSVKDLFGLVPGHGRCGVIDFFKMAGEEIHEVAVGPVHAGIIEPGHFRFQCHGEVVYHLEISLGYQHRGIERALAGGPDKRTIHYVETLAGDTTVGHAQAYCRIVESLTKCNVPARAQVIRGIAQELERIANHIGDLGALAGDIGFLPTSSYCGRIRGDVLNMTASLCGNRFSRGLIKPGGVGFDVDGKCVEELLKKLDAVRKDAESAVNLLWNTPSVQMRFEGIGQITPEICRKIGLVGVAARACGETIDVRQDFPYGIFRFSHIPVSTWSTGDVFARAFVRWSEIQRSIAFVRDQLMSLP
ncbi:MAG: hydrogenase, partial [Kiritimatiellae bacterium]|nr:hydrogenase [Kiritimatiellia bacterium]